MNERTAIVTGAAGTIGDGVVANLLAYGRRVVLVDRERIRLDASHTRHAETGRVLSVAVDLSEDDAPAIVARRIDEHGWQPASILVNNAAISIKHEGLAHNVADISVDEWDLMIRINVTVPMLMARQFLPHMRVQGWGRIINVASRAGRYNPNQAGPAYAVTKAAILGLSRSIANDFSKFGVTCNSIAPGLVESAMSAQMAPELLKALVDRTPVGRGGTAHEMGAAIAFLASEDAGFITGTCLDINGGQTMS